LTAPVYHQHFPSGRIENAELAEGAFQTSRFIEGWDDNRNASHLVEIYARDIIIKNCGDSQLTRIPSV
jgi:hypothetical protein